ncbi:hypothetical protein GCM10010254_02450 [Streptomyces chromofuscus]|nr:hypothetical protein GCM10010254_02450 [Streptomyces chromofuscus]
MPAGACLPSILLSQGLGLRTAPGEHRGDADVECSAPEPAVHQPDIVSRDTYGNVWRNNGNGKGSFGGRTKIATGWHGYKGLF